MAQTTLEEVSSRVSDAGSLSREAPSIDRLSNLPKDFLDQVLVRLPIRDLVRTSILSRKWRYAWSSVPDLTFDEDCRLALKDKPCLSCILLSVVDHALLLRSAPIRRFRMSNYLDGYNAHVDRWIVYLTKNGIEELHLQFKDGQNDYKMPSCLFSCKQLKVLELYCYNLMVPHTFRDYMNLIYIDLKVAFLSEASISHLGSRCSLLETLKLEYENHLTHLKIYAAKLKSLRVKGSFKDIFLDGCSRLIECEICLVGENLADKNEFVNIRNLEKVLACLPLLEELTADDYFLRFLSLGTRLHGLVFTFEHLKFLNIDLNFQDSKEISTAICIFGSSPKLETIEISVTWEKELVLSNDPYNWVDAECVFYQLKKFRMYCMNGKPPQMELLKLVLDNAPILETMYVTVDKEGKEEESRIMKSLLFYQRASATAKIVIIEE